MIPGLVGPTSLYILWDLGVWIIFYVALKQGASLSHFDCDADTCMCCIAGKFPSCVTSRKNPITNGQMFLMFF